MDTLAISPTELPNLMEKLTPRQMEIIGLLAQGNSNKQVARLLGICTDTVRKRIISACARAGVENRIQLIVLYAQWWAIEGKEK